MPSRRDPLAVRAADDVDLYDIADWEVRSTLDSVVVALYASFDSLQRALVIALAVLILFAEFVLGGLGVLLVTPTLGLFVLLSVVPTLALAAYVWYVDVTAGEPLGLLVVTFVLGVLFAGFAAVVNTLLSPVQFVGSVFGLFPLLGSAVFFYLVVGPVEETVKLLAVRLYAYRHSRFGAVVDGAVYGAVAGLGFATIENALFIARSVLAAEGMGNVIAIGTTTATVRALAGPGHVIYSAFAGYYLGLARFNEESAGPLVLKGILIAAFVHATYNTLVSFVPDLAADVLGISPLLAFLGFVLVYDGFFVALLFRKLSRYARLYRSVHANPDGPSPELTEFDP
jgi:RsiW-degrading membrane proteinase PrsW (M82 family)